MSVIGRKSKKEEIEYDIVRIIKKKVCDIYFKCGNTKQLYNRLTTVCSEYYSTSNILIINRSDDELRISRFCVSMSSNPVDIVSDNADILKKQISLNVKELDSLNSTLRALEKKKRKMIVQMKRKMDKENSMVKKQLDEGRSKIADQTGGAGGGSVLDLFNSLKHEVQVQNNTNKQLKKRRRYSVSKIFGVNRSPDSPATPLPTKHAVKDNVFNDKLDLNKINAITSSFAPSSTKLNLPSSNFSNTNVNETTGGNTEVDLGIDLSSPMDGMLERTNKRFEELMRLQKELENDL